MRGLAVCVGEWLCLRLRVLVVPASDGVDVGLKMSANVDKRSTKNFMLV